MTSHRLTTWLFLRLLGVCALVAFLSFGVQLSGLIGAEGITPAVQLAEVAQEHLGASRWWKLPSLFWLWPSDALLWLLVAMGTACSALVVADFAVGPALLGVWVTYLSLSSVSRPWLNYQWDTLLVETAFVALLVAPWQLRWRVFNEPTRAGVWAVRILWLRLLFFAGFVKLSSGDPTWASATALTFHHWTQPLPGPLSLAAHHWLPHSLEWALTLGVELVLCWGLFLGRRGRVVAAASSTVLMLGLAATGNYGFFQALTLALCVMLLDDEVLGRLRSRITLPEVPELPRWHEGTVTAVAVVLITLGTIQGVGQSAGWGWLPESGRAVMASVQPFRTVNRYGLFARMTTRRPELRIEGTLDGLIWEAYRLPYKVEELDRAAPQVAPHMPRLDWQLWFAALSRCDREPWLRALMERLLEAEPAVLGLFRQVPFDGQPPKAVRVVTVDLEPAPWGAEAQWTEVTEQRLFCPVVSR